jgi:bacterioferritin
MRSAWLYKKRSLGARAVDELLALSLYKKLLQVVESASIYLEEYTRALIGEEEQHQLEIRKMLKDFS